MEAVQLLRNRVDALAGMTRGLIEDAAGLDWATPLLPGTSPLGLTLWHMPRTVDWAVNTCIRVAPELADEPRFGELPDPQRFGFGTALSEQQATEAASQVHSDVLVAYSDAVFAIASEWVATLSPEDLDAPVPDFLGRQSARPAYATDGALEEVQGLVDVPVGILLARPTMSHLLMHTGEVDLIIQVARR
ncbi:MAG: hypothetical protein QOK42_1423 [Frankiaceae bacterium]|nr:hypothetical protein [Frankiaceae bacterium]